MRSLTEWWRSQAAAKDLHKTLSKTPGWSQWRLPCDTSKPDDVIVARAVMLLLQKHPDKYKVVWGSKSLTIYHADAYQATMTGATRQALERGGLVVPPRSDADGIHSPPAEAGGVSFERSNG